VYKSLDIDNKPWLGTQKVPPRWGDFFRFVVISDTFLWLNLGLTLGKAPNQGLYLVNVNTQGLSDVIEASFQVYPTSTGKVAGSDELRKAFGKVAAALLAQTGKVPGPATVNSPALNVTVSQAVGRTISFVTSVANTTIQLPNNLAVELETNKLPITVAMWTSPRDVHGGALNVS